jgi:hypothetical protein
MTDDNKIINEPAGELDGAKVIKWAWSGDKPFGLVGEIEIYGLAICRYDGSDDVYRFSCDKDWEVQQDGLYNSIDEAIRQLPGMYKFVIATWTNKKTSE